MLNINYVHVIKTDALGRDFLCDFRTPEHPNAMICNFIDLKKKFRKE